MKTVELSKATAPLKAYVRDVSKEAMIVTIEGKPVAALVAIQNADLETVTLSTHPQFLALIERARARHKSQGGISSKEMRRRLSSDRTAHVKRSRAVGA